MKSNLHKNWKTNSEVETQGVGFPVGEGAFIIVKRMGGANSKSVEAALAQYYKPYASAIQRGTFSEERENEIMTRVLVDSSVVGWEGITDENGKAIEFNKDVAYELLKDLPELRKELTEFASNVQNFTDAADFKVVQMTESEKEDLGKS